MKIMDLNNKKKCKKENNTDYKVDDFMMKGMRNYDMF